MSVLKENLGPDETVTLKAVSLVNPAGFIWDNWYVNDLAGTALICSGADGSHHVVRKPEGLWPIHMPRTQAVKQGYYSGVIEPPYTNGEEIQCKKIDEPYKFKNGAGVYQYRAYSSYYKRYVSLEDIVKSYEANLYPPPEKDYGSLFYTYQELGQNRRIVTGSAGEGARANCWSCMGQDQNKIYSDNSLIPPEVLGEVQAEYEVSAILKCWGKESTSPNVLGSFSTKTANLILAGQFISPCLFQSFFNQVNVSPSDLLSK